MSNPAMPLHLAPAAGRSFVVPGEQHIVKLAGRHTGGAYSISHLTLPPYNELPGLHAHDPYETAYVLDGLLHLLTLTPHGEPHTLPAAAGSLLHIPSRVPHAYHNPSTSPAHCLIITAPAGLEHFIAELGSLPDARALTPTTLDLPRIIAIHHKHRLDFHTLSEGE